MIVFGIFLVLMAVLLVFVIRFTIAQYHRLQAEQAVEDAEQARADELTAEAERIARSRAEPPEGRDPAPPQGG